MEDEPTDAQSDNRGALSEKTKEKPLDFPVVGIGASAGGLEAMTSFFRNMPENNGMAFVVI
jgi:two-component system CheB/CheR fusion protein